MRSARDPNWKRVGPVEGTSILFLSGRALDALRAALKQGAGDESSTAAEGGAR